MKNAGGLPLLGDTIALNWDNVLGCSHPEWRFCHTEPRDWLGGRERKHVMAQMPQTDYAEYDFVCFLE